jgi:hypothetical protein
VENILLKPGVKLACNMSQLLVTCYLGIPPIRLIQEIRKFKRHSFRGARRYGQLKSMMWGRYGSGGHENSLVLQSVAVQLRRCGRRDVHTGFWLGNLRERDHLEDLSIDKRITLKWIFKLQDGRVEWIYLAQDRNSWRALADTVMNFRLSQNEGNILSSWGSCTFLRKSLPYGVSKRARDLVTLLVSQSIGWLFSWLVS